MTDTADNDDYLFVRIDADRLARAMNGDVRRSPSAERLGEAQAIINHLGHLYRLAADFHVEDWQYKPTALTKGER